MAHPNRITRALTRASRWSAILPTPLVLRALEPWHADRHG